MRRILQRYYKLWNSCNDSSEPVVTFKKADVSRYCVNIFVQILLILEGDFGKKSCQICEKVNAT